MQLNSDKAVTESELKQAKPCLWVGVQINGTHGFSVVITQYRQEINVRTLKIFLREGWTESTLRLISRDIAALLELGW